MVNTNQEATGANFSVFDLTEPGCEPLTLQKLCTSTVPAQYQHSIYWSLDKFKYSPTQILKGKF